MPPRIKTSADKIANSLRMNTQAKLKKIQKPKKINIKLRDAVVDVKGLNYDMTEALEATRQALWDGEYQDISSRIEKIQKDLEDQKKKIDYIDTRLWRKADQALEECVLAAVAMTEGGQKITARTLNP